MVCVSRLGLMAGSHLGRCKSVLRASYWLDRLLGDEGKLEQKLGYYTLDSLDTHWQNSA